MFASRYFRLSLSLFALLSPLAIELASGQDDRPTSSGGLKDYAFSARGTRVKDLVGFFERMKDFDVYNDRKDVIVSLREVAGKLRFFIDGFPLELKCNKYVKLIERPNIRTFNSINLLVREDRLSYEIEQADANLISKIGAARSFDAIGRMQTIIQTLESERHSSRSELEPSVEKDLLDCVNYYTYRHQQATSGVVEFTRQALDRLEPSIVRASDSEVSLARFRAAIGRVESIEAADQRDAEQWIQSLSDLHDLILANHYEMPKLVHDFVTNSTRIAKLDHYTEVLRLADGLKHKAMSLEPIDESSANFTNYTQALRQLHELYRSDGEFLSDELGGFLSDNSRLQLILADIESDGRDSELERPSRQPDAREVHEPAPRAQIDPSVPIGRVALQEPEPLSMTRGDLVSCNGIRVAIQMSLRRFNLVRCDLVQAVGSTELIDSYYAYCAGDKQFDWPVHSMRAKLSRWSAAKLEAAQMSFKDQLTVVGMREMLADL